jgi:mannose/fructose/N-acetylgalactosamine-specific phosphotransferase system component IIB
MPIVLYRIDERLIHGQVVMGWGSQLRPGRYVVVDDALAASEWEQELYLLGVPDGVETVFTTVTQAQDLLPVWQEDPVRTVLLTRDVATMIRLAESGGMKEASVNVGGIHHEPGREQVLRYVYLDDALRDGLRALASQVKEVTARDLPGASAVSLESLVG